MSTQARTGLLALAIVGGVFTAAGLLVGGVLLAGREREAAGKVAADPGRPDRREPPATPAATPAATAGEKDDPNCQAILRHRFFDRKLSADDLERLIGLLLTASRDTRIYISAGGQFERHAVNEAAHGGMSLQPDGMTGPVVELRMNTWRTRPTRRQAVAAIKDALDEADFRRKD